jgi:hypothetical protein
MNQTQQGGSDPKTGAVDTGAPLLVLKKLDKRFGATHALKAVDLKPVECESILAANHHGRPYNRDHGSDGLGNCKPSPKPDCTFRNPNTISSVTLP